VECDHICLGSSLRTLIDRYTSKHSRARNTPTDKMINPAATIVSSKYPVLPGAKPRLVKIIPASSMAMDDSRKALSCTHAGCQGLVAIAKKLSDRVLRSRHSMLPVY
jgi:hypothetical protein